MITVERGGLRLLAFPALEAEGLVCALSTVPLDVRDARERRRLVEALGLDPARTVTTRQVHHADVVRAEEAPEPPDADGLVTAVPRLPLLMRAADCSLVAVFDRSRRALGVCHAGWKGSARGIVVNLVRALAEHYGSRPGDCLAAVGPTIGAARYPVGPEVPAAFLRSRAWAREYVTHREGRLHFDLAGANVRFLLECGIPRGSIETADLCTVDHPELLHSYRRDGTGGGHHGLVAAIL